MKWLICGLLLSLAATAEAQRTWRAEQLPFSAFDDDAVSAPSDARDIAVLRDGSVAILDFGRQEVRVFTANGTPIRTLGRKGRGPGEFELANGIAALGDGGLVVFDPVNARLTLFDAGGRFVRVVPFSGFGYYFRWDGVVLPDGRTADISMVPSKQANDTKAGIVRRSLTANKSDTLPLPACPEPPKYEPYIFKGGSAGVPNAPSVRRTIDPRGAIWCAASNAYEIWRIPFGATAPNRIVRGRATAEPFTDAEQEEARAALQEFADKAGGGTIDRSRFPKTKPLFSALAVDDVGRLWVLRHAGTMSVFDVFGSGSTPLATVPLPVGISGFGRIVVQKGVLTAVAEDDDGVDRVVRFRIRE